MVAKRRSTSAGASSLNRASGQLSILGIIVGTFLLPLVFLLFIHGRSWHGHLSCISDGWNSTDYEPEVTSSLCHVVENETMCFRFASNVTMKRCSKIGGVITNINSSASSAAAAAESSMMCYHNDCPDYVVNRSCFQYWLVLRQIVTFIFHGRLTLENVGRIQ